MNNIYLKLKNLLFVIAFYALHPLALIKRTRQYLAAQEIHPSSSGQIVGKISVLMVTYNANDFVKLSIESFQKNRDRDTELIVVDNNSNDSLKEYLKTQEESGVIDKLILCSQNNYFAGGNNIAAAASSPESTHLLLLNSDVEILNADWLKILRSHAPMRGVISMGKTDIPLVRPDGWCFMINRDIYLELGGINEYFKMNWGLTELTGKVGRKGYEIKAIINPEKYIKHYGQRSYVRSTIAEKFNRLTNAQVFDLFKGVDVKLMKVRMNI